MKFSGEENVVIFAKITKLDFIFDHRNLLLLIYVFSRPSIISVIRFNNNSIIFTETILKITKSSLKHFPWGNYAIEFPRNMSKAQFTKIDSREILGKAQMANTNYRKMSEKRIREN